MLDRFVTCTDDNTIYDYRSNSVKTVVIEQQPQKKTILVDAQRFQKLIYLPLFTDYFMTIFPQSSELTHFWTVFVLMIEKKSSWNCMIFLHQRPGNSGTVAPHISTFFIVNQLINIFKFSFKGIWSHINNT